MTSYESATWRQLLLRRKVLDTSPSTLVRRLTTIDLTFLGMGATLGAGAYVLVGVIAQSKTGPSIIISFLIAGMASIMSALCYAEFGARVPRAGSAYVYSYVTVGEVLAWTTGWQLLLEYIIGASSVARAWSGYVDSLAGNAVSTWLNAHTGGWTVPGLAAYPDFLSFGVTIALALVCSLGVRESTIMNNVLTTVNVCVILFVIIAGAFFVNTANFTPFAPFGVSGIFSGAATAFFSYVGFDVIATSAEEAKNPSRAIPISIIASLLICMACYMAVAAIVVLMVPYAQIDTTAPLSQAFALHGAVWAKYIIAGGAICGLTTSLMTCIFPMPRIIYAISADGLLPAWLGAVHPRFKTPVAATMLCGTLAGALALIFDLNALADMMSIGTLLSYTLVAASVLVLRYRQHDDSTALLLSAGPPQLAGLPYPHLPQPRLDLPALSRGSVEMAASDLPAAAAPEGGSPYGRRAALAPLRRSGPGRGGGRKAEAGAADDDDSSVNGGDATPDDPLLLAAAAAAASSPLATRTGVDGRGGRAGLRLCGAHAAGFYLLPAWRPGHPTVRMWGGAGAWTSYAAAAAQLVLFVLGSVVASACLVVLQTYALGPAAAWALLGVVGAAALVMVYAGACLVQLPQAIPAELSFVTPGAPYLPLVSVAVNVYLLVSLSPLTWVRFAVWCFIGTVIYVFYGIRHSTATVLQDGHVPAAAAEAGIGGKEAAGIGASERSGLYTRVPASERD